MSGKLGQLHELPLNSIASPITRWSSTIPDNVRDPYSPLLSLSQHRMVQVKASRILVTFGQPKHIGLSEPVANKA